MASFFYIYERCLLKQQVANDSSKTVETCAVDIELAARLTLGLHCSQYSRVKSAWN